MARKGEPRPILQNLLVDRGGADLREPCRTWPCARAFDDVDHALRSCGSGCPARLAQERDGQRTGSRSGDTAAACCGVADLLPRQFRGEGGADRRSRRTGDPPPSACRAFTMISGPIPQARRRSGQRDARAAVTARGSRPRRELAQIAIGRKIELLVQDAIPDLLACRGFGPFCHFGHDIARAQASGTGYCRRAEGPNVISPASSFASSIPMSRGTSPGDWLARATGFRARPSSVRKDRRSGLPRV